jgi:adenylate kinase family enzyme
MRGHGRETALVCAMEKKDMKLKVHKQKKVKLPPQILSVYFGVPGAGKTTFAAWLVQHDVKRGVPVWSNVPITGAYKLDPKGDNGNYMISNGRVIIDEAGIEYNNRDFKDFNKKSLYFYKYHRHYRLAVDVFSQGYDDMDKKIRMLAQRLYVVKRSILPWFVYRRRIGKRVGVSDVTKEIIDEYYFVPWSRKYIYSPPLWKLFNTISREEYEQKEWEKW